MASIERTAEVAELRAIIGGPNRSLGEQAYRQIRRGIVEGRWRPGEPLSEQLLATELGMSRTPIREAFGALRRDGLVQTIPGRGTFVVSLSAVELRELYEYREVLEGLAARLAAERASDPQLEDLAVIDQRGVRADVPEELVLLGVQFHEHIADMASNRRIGEALHAIEHQTHTARVLGYRLKPMIWTEHSAIARAIIGRDLDQAEQLARRHIHAARERLFAL